MGSMKKRQREGQKNEECIFDRFPDDLVVEIIANLAASSEEPHIHLAIVKSTCKSFKLAAEDILVKRRATLSKAHDWEAQIQYSRFLKDCLDAKNPCAVYIKGMTDYFQHKSTDAGIHQLKKAINMGSIEAVYALGMIYLSFETTSEQGFELLQKTIMTECIEHIRKRLWSIMSTMWKNHRLPLREYECKNLNCGMSKEKRMRRWDEDGIQEQYCSSRCMWMNEYQNFWPCTC